MSVNIFQQTWSAFVEDKATRLASAIAYSTIFSLTPLCIVLIEIAGFVIGLKNGGHGHRVVEAALLGQIQQHVGKDASASLHDIIQASFSKTRANVLAQIGGWAAFLIGASALFSSIQDALNAIWHIESTKGGWKQMLRDRLASFAILAVVGFLFIVSLIGTGLVSSIGTGVLTQIPILANPVIDGVVSYIVTGLAIMIAFAAMYKLLPDVTIAWRDVITGSFVTTVLFLIGEEAVGLYLHFAGTMSTFGAAGGNPCRLSVGLLHRTDFFARCRVHESPRKARGNTIRDNGSHFGRTACWQ